MLTGVGYAGMVGNDDGRRETILADGLNGPMSSKCWKGSLCQSDEHEEQMYPFHATQVSRQSMVPSYVTGAQRCDTLAQSW